MTDLDLARQLVAYVDRTTEPVTVPPTLWMLTDEPTDATDREDDMLSPNDDRPNRTRTWVLIAAAVAAVALVAGLLVASRDDDPVPVDEPEPAPTTAPIQDSEATDVEPLPFDNFDVGPGRYETGFLGVDAIFDVPVALQVFAAGAGRVVISDHAGIERPGNSIFPPDARFITFTRLGGWYTKSEATTRDHAVAAGISPDDPETWIEDNDVIATTIQTIEVAERPTRTWDAIVDPASDIDLEFVACSADVNPCFPIGSVARQEVTPTRVGDPWVQVDTVNRFWLIAIVGHEPLLVTAHAGADDEAWLDLVESTTIATLELGPDAPRSMG